MKRVVFGIGLFLIVGAVVVWLNRLQWGTASEALPEVVGYLNTVKSDCESRAVAAKNPARNRDRLRIANLKKGEELYRAAKSRVDGCVGFLQTATKMRFQGVTTDQIKNQLETVDQKVLAFQNWSNETTHQTYRSRQHILAPLLNLVPKIMNEIQNVDQAKIDSLCEQLEECRWRDWGELRH